MFLLRRSALVSAAAARMGASAQRRAQSERRRKMGRYMMCASSYEWMRRDL